MKNIESGIHNVIHSSLNPRIKSVGKKDKLLHPDNLRVRLKRSKNLVSHWVGDLCIHAGVPDVPMSQVLRNILDTFTSFNSSWVR